MLTVILILLSINLVYLSFILMKFEERFDEPELWLDKPVPRAKRKVKPVE